MMSHKQRMLAAMRGEMVDTIPFVPRLDLWWLANATSGTLPKEFEGMMPDDISRSKGWALYHMVPNFADITDPSDILHRGIGLFNFKLSAYKWRFSDDIEVVQKEQAGQQIVEYHTPLGVGRTVGGLTEEMKKAGSSLGWVQEHLIKEPKDYAIAGYLYENIIVEPNYDGFNEYMDMLGDEGVAAAGGPGLGGSPMHQIQKELIDDTRFFYEYRDNHKLMQGLAEQIGHYFNKVLDVLAASPAEVVLWGANYDDMLTYPPYFEKEIQPWLKKASAKLKQNGILTATHTDGENFGLMDLLKECGAQVAESVTPYPMTKVTIEEYYSQWHDHLTIMGGIPESVLLEETASEEEFEAFLDSLFANVAPGDRLILGTADSTPPAAKFSRLDRIAERVAIEGRLPLEGGSLNPVSAQSMAQAAKRTGGLAEDGIFEPVRKALRAGDEIELKRLVEGLLAKGAAAHDILGRGMLAVMEDIGELFKTGEVFIPEVLLAARALNEALLILEPHLATDGGAKAKAKFLIGTVEGDMHDIGKNMVAVMLRGVGFETVDIGTNVSTEEFVKQVQQHNPDIVGISALLTTTMPKMREVINALGAKGLRQDCKVIVGGAPVNQRFADEIGADGYARDAGEAVDVAKSLIG